MPEIQGQDPEILHDFVTESLELIETLDQDLVELEQRPDDPELLNGIFRALHTIKGASSFLALDPLTHFAHAAEDALNALRKAEASVTADTMDMLLRAADVIRSQVQTVDAGQMPEPGPQDLADGLRRIGSGGVQRTAKREQPVEDVGDDLELSESKRDLLSFMIDDLNESLANLKGLLSSSEVDVSQVDDIVEGLVRTCSFFELPQLELDVAALHETADALPGLDPPIAEAARQAMNELVGMMGQRSDALSKLKHASVDTEPLRQSLASLARNESPETEPEAEVEAAAETEAESTTSSAASAAEPAKTEHVPNGSTAERTIRVDVERLEALLNLVGELVLQKNRVVSIGRHATRNGINTTMVESLNQIGSDLERVTSDLQMSVMKTRMQPLSKVFNRYPRLIRDLARSTGKKINLVIDGGDTEVDKSVIEAIGDPLVHLLRNAGDHGIEMPEARAAAGKDEVGTIRLSACYEGNQVLVQITDDGKGLDRERIIELAIKRNLISADQAATISDHDVNQLIFAPGFSTAEKVSDLSGRGVGMDVVRNNINKLNGLVDVQSTPGAGSTIDIRIPLTVAIMPAMIVNVRQSLYALPLSNIVEIIRPEAEVLSTIQGEPTICVRDRVLPLCDLGASFNEPAGEKPPSIAVIVGLGEQRMGLLVDGLIGQQEVVIKPLDQVADRGALISGATIREDGGVSLILDIAALFKTMDNRNRRAA